MFKTCHHVMPNGLRCQSPAMRGYAFCYYHGRRASGHKDAQRNHIELPTCLIALESPTPFARSARTGQQSPQPRRASILLYGLQMQRLIGTARPRVASIDPILPGCPLTSAPCSLR